MKTVRYLDEEIVIKKGVEVLIKELGPVEAIRFINLPKRKRLESMRRHREWQKLLNKDRFFKEVFNENVRSRTNRRDQTTADTK